MYKLLIYCLLEMGNFKTNKYRLFRSNKFIGNNFMKYKQNFVDNDDLIGERDLILEYLVEGIEITYTLYIMFIISSYLSFAVSLMLINNKILFTVPLVSSIIFRFISLKKRESLLFEAIGYDLAKSIYNNDIKKKYNM